MRKAEEKIVHLNELLAFREQCRNTGKQVVWTNGCFDVMHAGHVIYLQQAKEYGDFLVVGVNSDRSVRELKGKNRPVCCQEHRALVVAALECVDFVLIFEQKSPVKILEQLKPDFYVKGGDYTIDTIDQLERMTIESYSGKIVILPLVDGISTSLIIEKIKRMSSL